jgi:hypothetical protein
MRRVLSVAALSVVAALAPGAAMAATSAGSTLAGAINMPARTVHVFHNSVTSSNWGGYGVQESSTTSKFTNVVGSWREPTVKCTSSTHEYSSFWVGLDGYSDQTVEQLGSDSDCDGVGKPSYYAWYEMYPAGSVNISRANYPVKAGDTLTAEVSVSGTTYTLSIKSSEGWSFSIKKTGTSKLKDSSAEWIAESPFICSNSSCSQGHLAKLPDFGKVTFTGSEAETVGGSDEPVSSFTAHSGPHKITCETSSGTVRMAPSALSGGGEKFTMTWKHD